MKKPCRSRAHGLSGASPLPALPPAWPRPAPIRGPREHPMPMTPSRTRESHIQPQRGRPRAWAEGSSRAVSCSVEARARRCGRGGAPQFLHGRRPRRHGANTDYRAAIPGVCPNRSRQRMAPMACSAASPVSTPAPHGSARIPKPHWRPLPGLRARNENEPWILPLWAYRSNFQRPHTPLDGILQRLGSRERDQRRGTLHLGWKRRTAFEDMTREMTGATFRWRSATLWR